MSQESGSNRSKPAKSLTEAKLLSSPSEIYEDKTKNIRQHAAAGYNASMTNANLSQLLLEWYKQNGRCLPWRVKGGAHPDPYIILVSEIMLQQTTVKTVIPYFYPVSYTHLRAHET